MELSKLKFHGDFGAASEVVLKSIKKNPDNKQLEIMSNYLSTSYMYVNSLEMQLQEAILRINKMREARDEALETSSEFKELYEKLQERTIYAHSRCEFHSAMDSPSNDADSLLSGKSCDGKHMFGSNW